MGSEPNRFLQQQLLPTPRRKRWEGCLCGLSCFRKQKGGKRIVPSSRIPESNSLSNQANGPQAAQATGINLSLLAPPSSPASFSNSALQSTAQSPNCFLSANSPPGPTSNMFATGPYANEMQLVSPPVFSTFTTEPSTAPLTPPPELAHLTTPSSPDVPYARFIGPGGPSKSRQDSNFFCPETFAQFYLDQSSFSHTGGRLSISKESDAYSSVGNGHQNRQSKTCKPDAEELEAYRASFGFSADDIVTTTHYVEISDVMDDSFSMRPFTEEHNLPSPAKKLETEKIWEDFPSLEVKTHLALSDQVPHKRFGDASVRSLPNNHTLSDEEDIYSKMGASRIGRKYQFGSSNSDAEIEYRRGRSLRERRTQPA
ncbi:hypothetical protein ACJIZ3_019300 [Penstemon smallii]|uniref:Hydroxyproline-rich glycoprotein family protein n=1 Tax=Penstemon smallii TaxID=265156 RepID=A0ABD3T1E0_9LAMI